MHQFLRTCFLSTSCLFMVYLALRVGCSAVLQHAAADGVLRAVASVCLDALEDFALPVSCLLDMSAADSVVAMLMGAYFVALGLVIALTRMAWTGRTTGSTPSVATVR